MYIQKSQSKVAVSKKKRKENKSIYNIGIYIYYRCNDTRIRIEPFSTRLSIRNTLQTERFIGLIILWLENKRACSTTQHVPKHLLHTALYQAHCIRSHCADHVKRGAFNASGSGVEPRLFSSHQHKHKGMRSARQKLCEYWGNDSGPRIWFSR